MDKYALVTGGNAGIGKATCLEFAKKGYNIVIVGRKESSINEVKEQIENQYHVKAFGIAIDISEDSAPEKILQFCRDNGIEVDILINNAGIGGSGDYASSNWEKQKAIVTLNNIALMHMVRVFLPEMLERGQGRICNVASNAGFMPLAPQPIYGASKAFVISFSQAIHEEYRKRGVTSSVVCPGATKTDFFKTNGFELKNLKGVTPDKVAKVIYKTTTKGKAFASVGLSVKCMQVLSRLFPRSIVRKVAKKVGESE